MKRKFFLLLYYSFAYYLPDSYYPVKLIGKACNAFRIFCVRRIFKSTGDINTICRKVYFGTGHDVEIGDDSGIGTNARVPHNIKIGKHVMIAPDLLAFRMNHKFDDPGKTLCEQGVTENPPIRIGDNVWIGQRVIITPGRVIPDGTIVAAGSVVARDFEPNMVVGGNPAKVLKPRYSAE